jgi:anti-sigma factor RsiW
LCCREVVELLTDYAEGALTSRERRRLERHLVDCPACRAYAGQIRLTLDLLREWREDPPAELCADLVAEFRGWSARA